MTGKFLPGAKKKVFPLKIDRFYRVLSLFQNWGLISNIEGQPVRWRQTLLLLLTIPVIVNVFLYSLRASPNFLKLAVQHNQTRMQEPRNDKALLIPRLRAGPQFWKKGPLPKKIVNLGDKRARWGYFVNVFLYSLRASPNFWKLAVQHNQTGMQEPRNNKALLIPRLRAGPQFWEKALSPKKWSI